MSLRRQTAEATRSAGVHNLNVCSAREERSMHPYAPKATVATITHACAVKSKRLLPALRRLSSLSARCTCSLIGTALRGRGCRAAHPLAMSSLGMSSVGGLIQFKAFGSFLHALGSPFAAVSTSTYRVGEQLLQKSNLSEVSQKQMNIIEKRNENINCTLPAGSVIIRGSVHGERSNFTGLVLGSIAADICKKTQTLI